MNKKTKKILNTIHHATKNGKKSIIQNLLTENVTNELKNMGFQVNNCMFHSHVLTQISWGTMENSVDDFFKVINFFSFEDEDDFEVEEVEDDTVFIPIIESFNLSMADCERDRARIEADIKRFDDNVD